MILTDLDGTLLDADGTLAPEARTVLQELQVAGETVIPLTSKTRVELLRFLAEIPCGNAGSFENGAGFVDGSRLTILLQAIPVEPLRQAFDEVRRATSLPLVALEEMTDDEVVSLTGLARSRVGEARRREWDFPFLAPRDAGAALARAVDESRMAVIQGDRFWHLSGRHDKADAAARILEARGRGRLVVGLGDAPNDAGFLALADRVVLVPRAGHGVDPVLRAAFPDAFIACGPGAGWAATVRRIVLQENHA